MVVFFFFKQKTAYEIKYGLVGSEMCIGDRARPSAQRCETGGVGISCWAAVPKQYEK